MKTEVEIKEAIKNAAAERKRRFDSILNSPHKDALMKFDFYRGYIEALEWVMK